MLVKIAWSSIYLQFSSFNFLCSGLFGDILCLRFFLTWAYIWLFVNAVTGFPPWGELFAQDVFVLHIDVLLWTTVTLYTHASKFIGIVLNERQVKLPSESLPLWCMLYRNSGLSQLLFKQFVWPRFPLVQLKKGDHIPLDECIYIILEGIASTTVTLKNQKRLLMLGSGEVINVKYLHLFHQAQCEAFADQTVHATCETDMKLYRCTADDIQKIAGMPQCKQAYQGLLIFSLTNIAERAILGNQDYDERQTRYKRNPAFAPLEPWEEPQAIYSGSGKALTDPLRHFYFSLENSYRPPWPIVRWIPGLRHAALRAPHLLSSTKKRGDEEQNASNTIFEAGPFGPYGSVTNASNQNTNRSGRDSETKPLLIAELNGT